jgi:hypothetical protein
VKCIITTVKTDLFDTEDGKFIIVVKEPDLDFYAGDE